MAVLRLTKRLDCEPHLRPVARARLRHYGGTDDIAPWLALRAAAVAALPTAVRKWTEREFYAEFLMRPWWRPERMWLAEANGGLVGSVTLAQRGPPEGGKPVVHWLLVAPDWRRRGVGRMLMAALERECWRLGGRQLWLETHASWTEAVGFYAALGYVPVL